MNKWNVKLVWTNINWDSYTKFSEYVKVNSVGRIAKYGHCSKHASLSGRIDRLITKTYFHKNLLDEKE